MAEFRSVQNRNPEHKLATQRKIQYAVVPKIKKQGNVYHHWRREYEAIALLLQSVFNNRVRAWSNPHSCLSNAQPRPTLFRHDTAKRRFTVRPLYKQFRVFGKKRIRMWQTL